MEPSLVHLDDIIATPLLVILNARWLFDMCLVVNDYILLDDHVSLL